MFPVPKIGVHLISNHPCIQSQQMYWSVNYNSMRVQTKSCCPAAMTWIQIISRPILQKVSKKKNHQDFFKLHSGGTLSDLWYFEWNQPSILLWRNHCSTPVYSKIIVFTVEAIHAAGWIQACCFYGCSVTTGGDVNILLRNKLYTVKRSEGGLG